MAASKAAAAYGFSRRQTNDSASSMSISIMTPSETSELSEADFDDPERQVSFRRQHDEDELTFSISLKESNVASSHEVCSTASFNPEWMRSQDSELFCCSCGNCDGLDYTCKSPKPPFPLLELPEPNLIPSSGSCKHFRPHHGWSANMDDPCIFESLKFGGTTRHFQCAIYT